MAFRLSTVWNWHLSVIYHHHHHLCIHVIWSHLLYLVQEARHILLRHSFLSLLTILTSSRLIHINLKPLSIFFCQVNFGAYIDLFSVLWYSESACLTGVSSGSLSTCPLNLNLLWLISLLGSVASFLTVCITFHYLFWLARGCWQHISVVFLLSIIGVILSLIFLALPHIPVSKLVFDLSHLCLISVSSLAYWPADSLTPAHSFMSFAR